MHSCRRPDPMEHVGVPSLHFCLPSEGVFCPYCTPASRSESCSSADLRLWPHWPLTPWSPHFPSMAIRPAYNIVFPNTRFSAPTQVCLHSALPSLPVAVTCPVDSPRSGPCPCRVRVKKKRTHTQLCLSVVRSYQQGAPSVVRDPFCADYPLGTFSELRWQLSCSVPVSIRSLVLIR